MKNILSIKRADINSKQLDISQKNLRVIPVTTYKDDLANLLFLSFHGTLDDNGETPDFWNTEVSEVFEEKYGEIIQELSFCLVWEDKLVGTFITTIFRGVPLIIYVAIHPDFRGRHFSKSLFNHAFNELIAATHYEEVYLVVKTNNQVAYNLYSGLGFKKVGTDWDSVLNK